MTGHRPLLVTGVPRSGTTWLARLLALAPGGCMTGREPMNARNRQFALAGTLSGWARLDVPDPRQQRVLRRTYAGLEPRTYGRFGERQWRCPLPGARLVVKDPFAVLSVGAVEAVTGARTVLVYRHPGAVLDSYRRMGWTPDVAELAAVLGTTPPPRALDDPVTAMAWFWSACHEVVLDDVDGGADVTVVSHAEVSSGGAPALRTLVERCGLTWGRRLEGEVAGWSSRRARPEATPRALHDFDRPPGLVAEGWRRRLDRGEVDRIEAATVDVRERLAGVRLTLATAAV